MKIVGYSDPLSVRAGEPVAFKVSSESLEYNVQIVRMIHGDENPKGPGLKVENVKAPVNGKRPGRKQELRKGSYVELDRDEPLRTLRAFTVSAWIYPTALRRGSQAILGAWSTEGSGYGLFVGEGGFLEFRLAHADGRRESVRSPKPLTQAQWHFVAGSFDPDHSLMTVFQRHDSGWLLDNQVASERVDGWDGLGGRAAGFLIGAYTSGFDGKQRLTSGHFNGKIEAPAVIDQALKEDELTLLSEREGTDVPGNAVALWDLSASQSSRTVVDRAAQSLNGRTVNLPTRGVTSHRWDGTTVGFPQTPSHYAAIHFHDDDLDDARWSTDFTWDVPADTKSGIYAAHVTTSDGARDFVPFFVRPKAGNERGDILFLVPTFSYLAYSNDHNAADPALRASLEVGDDFVYPSQPEDKYIVDEGLGGIYDLHTDGTSVVYSSYLHPVLTMRPTYRQPLLNNGHGDPHQLPADLHMIDWLEHFGHDYHVTTDEDVDRDGLACLAGYKVVITGTHPEYWSFNGLNAMNAYLQGGGRLMYVGGNGFYWVTSLESEQHTVEVRKWGGTAAFEVPTGEVFNSTTGELGGLWRFRGRHPQRLVGVGMTAQGVAPGVGYRRLPDSHDPRASFIFEGIGDDEPIGDHPCLVNEYGAGGYEIDRADEALGTPRHALVVATATGLSDRFQHVREEIMLSDSKQGGTVNPKVRADMVYFECPNDGAVWSVGSISWCSALSYNNYENAVSRITRNVLKAFVR